MNADNAHNPTAAQNEDLFDFPVVEMQADGSTQARPSTPRPAPTPVAAPAPAPAPKLDAAPKPKPAPKPAPKPLVKPKPAAELEAPAPAAIPTPAPTPRRSSPGKAWVMIIALSALNLGGFVFLWSTSRSVQQSIEALRAAQPVQSTTTTAAPVPVQTPAPLQSFDQLALTLARQELSAGDFAGARRRLARLLAVIDQVDPQARAVVEAEAMYLSAQAYEKALEQRLEGKP